MVRTDPITNSKIALTNIIKPKDSSLRQNSMWTRTLNALQRLQAASRNHAASAVASRMALLPHIFTTSTKRYVSTAVIDDDDERGFTERFLDVVRNDLPLATDPAKSSQLLRRLVKSELLRFTDMRAAPEKFFLAHRLLSSVGLNGFGVRFTVQFNLFAGSILGLGGEEQIALLDEFQRDGTLGCFLLTEKKAGVLSGLIVETTCDWCQATESFTLHTPSDSAAKNWISQGFVAERGVVIADLRIDGKSHGPHAFLMTLRDGEGGQLLPGIRVEDMGSKTIANDLDNARVWFDKVRLPKKALLNKFADLDAQGRYVQVGEERMRIEVIGQRLLTGRQAIAEAALVSARVLHMRTEAYASQKVCNGLSGERTLESMPQMRAVLDESYAALDAMEAFTAGVEERLNECLRAGTIPGPELVDAIAIAKIKCIDVAIQRCHALRQEVGSYALMHATGFELVEMLALLQVCRGGFTHPSAEAGEGPAQATQKAGPRLCRRLGPRHVGRLEGDPCRSATHEPAAFCGA